ncbi:MAG TPA: acetyl-CoA carboxylase biotin carboxyl carrier protein [Methylomirabilota bacterium]|nr:acetyl-CoA carboxylase biotin carboxyl carrier protein [Methylomirabilota bacterium]
MAKARRPRTSGGAAPGDERAVELTRRLAALLTELDLAEVEVESAEVRVRVQRSATVPVAQPANAAAPATAILPVERPLVADVVSAALVSMEAPMVGTFYRASSPTADPYVHEGDMVKEGQVLCIIEAMKLMNEIESKVAGRVARILVENGQAVEYGQALFLIDPRA